MDISSVLAGRGQSSVAINPRQKEATSFADLLLSRLAAQANTASTPGTQSTAKADSLEDWMQKIISENPDFLPASIRGAESKSNEMSGYLSGIFSAAFKEAGIAGTHGLSAVFQDGGFSVVGRMIQNFPDRPINGIGMTAPVEPEDNGNENVDTSRERWNTNHYHDLMSQRIATCLSEVFAAERSDVLGEFSLNKAIHELSKFNSTFARDYDADPLAAFTAYRDEIAAYMPGVMFPVNGGK